MGHNPYDTEKMKIDGSARSLLKQDIEHSFGIEDDERMAEEIETHVQQFLEHIRSD